MVGTESRPLTPNQLLAENVVGSIQATAEQYISLDMNQLDRLNAAITDFAQGNSTWSQIRSLTHLWTPHPGLISWSYRTRAVFESDDPNMPKIAVRTRTPNNDGKAISKELIEDNPSLYKLHRLFTVPRDERGNKNNWHFRAQLSVATVETDTNPTPHSDEVPIYVRNRAVTTFSYDYNSGLIVTKVNPGVVQDEGNKGLDLPVQYFPNILDFALNREQGINLISPLFQNPASLVYYYTM